MSSRSRGSASVAPRPGLARGRYPERDARGPSWAARVARRLLPSRTRARAERFVDRVRAHGGLLCDESAKALAGRVAELRLALRRNGSGEPPLAEAFAVVREVARRELGTPHYDVQLLAGWGMARGMLVEMETGEGKTLAATLPACVAALAGVPVHVVSANEYLVARDAESLAPLYRGLGLQVAAVAERDRDPRDRRRAYGSDVVYATAKQLAFDYLRDRGLRRQAGGRLREQLGRLRSEPAERLLLRGLCYAIVDEADHVLVDEACTPLVLAGPGRGGVDPAQCRRALRLASALEPGVEFRLDRRRGTLELSDRGRDRLAELARPLGGIWGGARRREEEVLRALRALHLLVRDRDYLVREGRVQIIDGPTGRVSTDRSWQMGLHQLLEVKEGCRPTPEQETVARISYQSFFRRYLHLSGTSGTAREVAGELWRVYGMETLRVPTRRPSRRVATGARLHGEEGAWREALVAAVRREHARGRPVLVGTWSLSRSEQVAAVLAEAGLPTELLNAAQDRNEARVVARAGARGRITVATQMAGRGTDIRLGPGVEEIGGLHVVSAGVGAARRLDRQLLGRCGRQGDPGSHESIAHLGDELLAGVLPARLLGAVARLGPAGRPLPAWLSRALTRWAQMAEERRRARLRRGLVHLEEHLDELLAFAGPAE